MTRAFLLACLFATVNLTAQTPQQEPDLQKGEDRGFEWMYRQRAFPLGRIPAGVGWRALQQLDRLKQQQRARPTALRGPKAAVANTWTPIGPQPMLATFDTADLPAGRTRDFGGSVQAWAVDPRSKDTVYLGGSSGGVWKTTDGGNTWASLTDNQPWLPIGSFAIDPSNPDTVYAGTGWPWGLYGEGILKTTNAGATWSYIAGPFASPDASDNYYGGGAKIRAMAVSPSNGQVVLAAVWRGVNATQGIYRSSDGGATWKQVLTGGDGSNVFFYVNNANIAYAALGWTYGRPADGVYKSADGGQTWSTANGSGSSSLPVGNIGDILLQPAPSQPATMYAAIWDLNQNFTGFYKTTDGGTNWTLMPPLLDLPADPPQTIAVHPTNPNAIVIGSHDYINRSTDGGSTWARAIPPRFTDNRSFVFSPDGSRLYLGDDAGAYSTDSPLSAFTMSNLNHTLPLVLYYAGISLHPTNPNITFGGAQDLGISRYSGSQTWDWVFNCDGGATAIDFTTPTTIYATCDRVNSPYLIKSTSNGDANSWKAAQTGINIAETASFIPPLTMDPSNSQRLYYGTTRVYQTNNGATSWQAISPLLTTDNSGFASISWIAVAPSSADTVYAGTAGGIAYVSTNATSGATSTWKNVTAGLPTRAITAITVHPTSPGTAYLTMSGFSGFSDQKGHIFKTTDTGAHWTDISGNLPNTPLNDIVVDPDLPGTLYAASDIGVFISATDGTTWSPLGSGMPPAIVNSLRLHRGARILRAATFGRGMYDLAVPLASTPAPTISAGGVVNAASYKNQALAAGTIASVFGSNFSATPLQATQLPLPNVLGGVSVLVNGQAAPLFYVSATQVNFQMPWTFGSAPEPLVVTVTGVPSASQTISAGQFYSPGIFTTDSSGKGQGAIQIANTTIFAATAGSIPGQQSRPAQKGVDYLTIYCNGLGDVQNRPANGATAIDGSSTTLQPVTVTIGGGAPAPASFSGLAPGFVGLYQVNVQVPANAPSGNAVTLTISVGGVTSNAVTIAVQ
jgi:uncharacterized protein (TIGR03437 family)